MNYGINESTITAKRIRGVFIKSLINYRKPLLANTRDFHNVERLGRTINEKTNLFSCSDYV